MGIRVLIIDDSASMRALLSAFLKEAPFISEVYTANDAYEGREMIVSHKPDVLCLDIEMPRMDGITFLRKLMQHHPMPVIMVSLLTKQGVITTLTALEAGAIDFIEKPQQGGEEALNKFGQSLIQKVKSAATSQMKATSTKATPSLQFSKANKSKDFGKKVIAIGASTGGLAAIKPLIQALPLNSPPVLIVQHLPKEFSQQVVDRLNTYSSHTVVLAKQGDDLQSGFIYFAPGNKHLLVTAQRRISLTDTPKVNGHRPAVDELFKSMATNIGKDGIGVILTGMGGDGAQGLLKMRKSGAFTIGQDPKSSTIYGMPKIAYDIGAVMEQCGLHDIVRRIIRYLDSTSAS